MDQDINADADEMPVDSQDDVESDATSDPEDDFDRDRAMATIRKLRQEAKAATRAIRENAALKAQQAEAEKAKLSEDERRTRRIAELEQQAQERDRKHREDINRYEVQLQAGRLGIVDPEAAVKLLDWQQLDYGEDGRPQNVDEALQALIDAKPYLKAPTPRQAPSAASTNGATRPTATGKPRYDESQLSDYDFYTQHRADIQAAYREGRINLGR